jgi:hypothetical protein
MLAAEIVRLPVTLSAKPGRFVNLHAADGINGHDKSDRSNLQSVRRDALPHLRIVPSGPAAGVTGRRLPQSRYFKSATPQVSSIPAAPCSSTPA